jgi:ABC-2 type transport system ATP-binding protein
MNAPDEQTAIRIEGLTKSFGRTKALDRLAFEVPAGVIAGFVGPNGAGKTTTIRILATLLKPDAGTARVFGFDTARPAEAVEVRHRIGFMPDYFGLYTDMTAAEYLEFFAAAYRIPADRRARLVEDMLALVSLTDKRDALIAGLSRGMQQKLSLGRALIHSPQLLLLDEPASGLDPRARIELMELLRELKTMGKTIFISSHILSELHHLCDTVVILENGRTLYTGSVDKASDHVQAGKRFLALTLDGDLDAAVAALKALPGVQALTRKERLVMLEHDVSISSADLIGQAVRAGLRVEEARRESASLEEVFLHMTGGREPEPQPPPLPEE